MADPEKKMIQAYVTRVLQGQVDFLDTQLQGLRYDPNIEYLHHTRVMSRRLRNSLEVFGEYIGKKKARKLLVGLEKLTKQLTKIRDLDVQIQFLENFLHKLADQKNQQGIARLLLRMRQKRDLADSKISAIIEEFDHTDVIPTLDEFIEEHPYNPEDFFPTEKLSKLAKQNIDENIRECFLYVPFITNPSNVEQLHQLRIGIKNLRYVVELFEPIFPGLKEDLEVLKSFQNDLGMLHDYDVWLDELQKFADQEMKKVLKFYGQSGPFNFIKPGLDFLVIEITSARMQTFDHFLNNWNTHFQDQFWTRLQSHIFCFPAYEDNLASKPEAISEEAQSADST